LKTYLAEGIVNKHQCLVVDSHDTFRSKESWTKFLPQVAKSSSGLKGEESKAQDASIDQAKL
jgi:hypothetical protein